MTTKMNEAANTNAICIRTPGAVAVTTALAQLTSEVEHDLVGGLTDLSLESVEAFAAAGGLDLAAGRLAAEVAANADITRNLVNLLVDVAAESIEKTASDVDVRERAKAAFVLSPAVLVRNDYFHADAAFTEWLVDLVRSKTDVGRPDSSPLEMLAAVTLMVLAECLFSNFALSADVIETEVRIGARWLYRLRGEDAVHDLIARIRSLAPIMKPAACSVRAGKRVSDPRRKPSKRSLVRPAAA